jgi:hypothetical protein
MRHLEGDAGSREGEGCSGEWERYIGWWRGIASLDEFKNFDEKIQN